MRTYVQPVKSLETMANEAYTRTFGSTHFQDKETRDKVAERVLFDHGIKLKKSTSRGSQLHPEFVCDYAGEIETGFGNTQYQTYWKVLYNLSHERQEEPIVKHFLKSDFFK